MTIVCVYNDPAVRTACLDRSIELLRDTAPHTQYVPVDNTTHQFPTAGAALNHGAGQAVHDVVVFAHQDVFLHSLVALEVAAARLVADETFGILGPVGMAQEGAVIGRIRDRVTLIGEPVRDVRPVVSLDEVLFMVSRAVLHDQPLVDSPDLAWHAYAVEYGLRMRANGRAAGVADLPVTHNSLTINLARLREAHARVGAMYPEALPVPTTCGTIGGPATLEVLRRMAGRYSWYYPWLRESLAVQRQLPKVDVPVVLADIRRVVDDLLEANGIDTLHVMNVVTTSGEVMDPVIGTHLSRRGREVVFHSAIWDDARAVLTSAEPHDSWLSTGLHGQEATVLAGHRTDTVIGFHEGVGLWALQGPVATIDSSEWTARRVRPLGRGRR